MEEQKKEGLSRAMEDYLRAIYKLVERGQKVTTSALAEELGVAPASVTKMLKRLAEMELIEHQPYRGIDFTEEGEKSALKIVRLHRLLELFLAEKLGVPWDRVHEEAHRLEHVISEYLAERITELLDHPETDPHGHPIPSKDGKIRPRNCVPLATLEPGASGTIAEIEDQDPQLLRYLSQKGIFPNCSVSVIEREPYGGIMNLKVDGKDLSLGQQAAQHIWVILKES